MSQTQRRRSSKSARQLPKPRRRWSAKVAETSDAMDIEKDAFKSDGPKRIARSLKRSAEKSDLRKTTPFLSAMCMLNFYFDRAGKNLSGLHRRVLDAAKGQLRRLFHRASSAAHRLA